MFLHKQTKNWTHFSIDYEITFNRFPWIKAVIYSAGNDLRFNLIGSNLHTGNVWHALLFFRSFFRFHSLYMGRNTHWQAFVFQPKNDILSFVLPTNWPEGEFCCTHVRVQFKTCHCVCVRVSCQAKILSCFKIVFSLCVSHRGLFCNLWKCFHCNQFYSPLVFILWRVETSYPKWLPSFLSCVQVKIDN